MLSLHYIGKIKFEHSEGLLTEILISLANISEISDPEKTDTSLRYRC